jgi:hypothetical protein
MIFVQMQEVLQCACNYIKIYMKSWTPLYFVENLKETTWET